MITTVADTHALIWYLFADARLSTAARAAMDGQDTSARIALSSVSLVEIVYLEEKSRIPSGTLRGFYGLLDMLDPKLVEVPVTRQVVDAMMRLPRTEVPDMPDRVIAATALMLDVPLVSRDGRIRASSVKTLW